MFYFVSKTLKMSPTDQPILQQFYLILRNSLLNSLLNKGEKRLQIHNEIALSHTGYIFYVANLLFIQIYCANSLWILYLFPPIHSEFSISFVNSQWIHYLLGGFTLNPLLTSHSHFELAISFRNSPLIGYFSRINYGFTLSFANSLGIH